MEIIIIIITGILLILGALTGIWKIIEHLKPDSKIQEKILAIITSLSFMIFIIALQNRIMINMD